MAELTAASARSQVGGDARAETTCHGNVRFASDTRPAKARGCQIGSHSSPAGGRSSGMLDGIAACSRSLPACGLPLELALRRGYAVGIVDLSWTSMKRLNRIFAFVDIFGMDSQAVDLHLCASSS